MELHVAGGCGEHGRNCFHVKGEQTDFLVDCGLMAAERDGYPHLTKNDIPNIRTVFLTHSHADHTGALPWLYENGFHGEVVASERTLRQLALRLGKTVSLESICACGQNGSYNGLNLRWGKSGHCLGSVWYRFETEGKTILFSGDYIESSQVYAVDLIREQSADFAVLDCAYGRDTTTGGEACEMFLDTLRDLLRQYRSVALPVPKYGRGLDLLALLLQSGMEIRYSGDTHFLTQLQNMQRFPAWFRVNGKSLLEAVERSVSNEKEVTFLSDPQLKNADSYRAVAAILESGGIAMMTGTVDKGTNSERLMQAGKMVFCRYPVHLNFAQFQKLTEQNCFKTVIPYHSAEMVCDKTVYEY